MGRGKALNREDIEQLIRYSRLGPISGKEIRTQAAAMLTPPIIRTATPGRLRSLLLDAQDPVLLIGAGGVDHLRYPRRGADRRESCPLGLVQGERASS